MEGRAAKIIKSLRPKPEVIKSRSLKPVGIPVIPVLFPASASICSYTSWTTSFIDLKPSFRRPSDTPIMRASASDKRSLISTSFWKPSFAISSATLINLRRSD